MGESSSHPQYRPHPDERGHLGRRRWLAISVAVAALVIAAVVIAAADMARGSADDSRRSFERESNQVASSLTVEIERTQGLIESSAAFVAVHPRASNSDFASISNALQWRERHLEVGGFGFVVPVPASALEAFKARMEADPINPADRGVPYEVTPPGPRPWYCLAVLGQWRPGFTPNLGIGEDFCTGLAGGPLRQIWQTGESLYFPIALGDENGVAITIPVYRGGGTPETVPERRAAFLGWLGTVVAHEQLLAGALSNHPDLAATLRYEAGPVPASFSSGDAPVDATTMSIDLNRDWKLETAGSVQSAAIWSEAGALGLLAVGVPMGALLGSFVFVLGTGRARARRLVSERTDQLRHQALHDSLTGLPNRDLIADRIDLLLARNRRHETDGAALFIDLDDFKNVNDTLGHAAGDQLLQAVSARLESTLRDVDTIGRMGGDEFVVLIDGSEMLSGPELVAQRLLEVMRQPFEIEAAPSQIPITASIGIAIGNRETHDELLRDADVALYEAKAAGKNCYEVFDREMWHEATHRIELEFDLRSALENGQFRLVYQPIYDLGDLIVTGVEALLRWDHPTRGTIGPSEFIPILERTGQISEVGSWVMDAACRQAAEWEVQHGPLCLAVNLSARQLESDAVIEDLDRILDESGLDPEHLVVEITETALMHNVEATARRLGFIKELGVRIAVDDFGTGYSSMAYLRQFPVDCLKIDRAFTSSITDSSHSTPLFDTLIQLGRDLGLTTLAEGIERPEQIEHLKSERVDKGQGFFFSHPVAPEDFAVLLAEQAARERSS